MEVGFRNDIILHSSAATGVCMGTSFLCKLSVEISLLQHRNLNLKEARAIHVDARTYPSRKESSKPLPSHSPSPMLARSCALSLSLPSLSPSLFFHSFHASGHLRSELFFFPGSMTDTLCGVQGLVISIIKKKKKRINIVGGGRAWQEVIMNGQGVLCSLARHECCRLLWGFFLFCFLWRESGESNGEEIIEDVIIYHEGLFKPDISFFLFLRLQSKFPVS